MKKVHHKTPILFFIILSITILSGCDKSGTPSPVLQNTARCILQSETTALSGNYASWTYEYDSDGMPSKITKFGSTGAVVSVLEIFYNSTVRGIPNSVANRIVQYDADLFLKKLPNMAKVSITDSDGITQVNYLQYFFFYDDKLRLITVGEQTNFVGDWEWDLNIFYNDKNNVTGLQYKWTTGPNQPPTTITATAYDDNPTPYASMGFWKFLMSNFAWDNYDPEPILTALSSNNPLDYSFGAGDNLFTRTMTYTYNEHGFPLVRTNTNKNISGEFTFQQTFLYICQ